MGQLGICRFVTQLRHLRSPLARPRADEMCQAQAEDIDVIVLYGYDLGVTVDQAHDSMT